MSCEDCQNYKPKPKEKIHPLDDLIERIIKFTESGLLNIIDLKRLRYESIKWALENPTLVSVNQCLKARGHEDWIV